MPQTIDLTAIQDQIDQRRAVSGPLSSAPAPRGLPRALVETVWQLMGSLYGHRWVSAYGSEVDPDRVWSATLYGLDEAQIRAGMRKCVDQALDWPPSAPEFRGLCLGDVDGWERRQIAEADRAWRERALPPPRNESHAHREINRMREALGLTPKEITA